MLIAARVASAVDSPPMERERGGRPGTRFVVANGLRVGLDVVGGGPPLVLLHGASSSGREDFGAQVAALSRWFTCHLPDARGHATTAWDPAAGLHLADLVADVVALLDALELPAVHLVGFSMGGATALATAIACPQRIRTLVLVGTATEREPRTSVIRHLADVERIERRDPAWAAALARRHDPAQGPGAWRRLMPAIADFVARQASPPPVELRRVEMPALVVVGDRDPIVPVGQAWALARQLPDARLFVVPGCPHEVPSKRPALFLEGLLGFYRSTGAIGAGASAEVDVVDRPPIRASVPPPDGAS
jgi:pimeloyl-ACP methyl ester carboxylesterase